MLIYRLGTKVDLQNSINEYSTGLFIFSKPVVEKFEILSDALTVL